MPSQVIVDQPERGWGRGRTSQRDKDCGRFSSANRVAVITKVAQSHNSIERGNN